MARAYVCACRSGPRATACVRSRMCARAIGRRSGPRTAFVLLFSATARNPAFSFPTRRWRPPRTFLFHRIVCAVACRLSGRSTALGGPSCRCSRPMPAHRRRPWILSRGSPPPSLDGAEHASPDGGEELEALTRWHDYARSLRLGFPRCRCAFALGGFHSVVLFLTNELMRVED